MIQAAPSTARGRRLRVVFFGDRYFFSDFFFDAFRSNPGCELVAGVVAPPPKGGPASGPMPGKLLAHLRKLAAPAQWRRALLCARLGWPGRIPAEAMVLPLQAEPTESMPVSWIGRDPDMPLLQPSTLARPDSETTSQFAALEPDLFVSAGYTRIIGEPLLALPRRGAFNFHPSKLPAFRGGSSVFFALREGASEVALTCHRMEAGVDTGDIAYQQTMSTTTRSRVLPTYLALVRDSIWMADRLIKDSLAGTVPSLPQTGTPSFFLAPRQEHMQIDWHGSASMVEGLVCACDGYAECSLDGARLRIVNGCAERSFTDVRPGTVVGVGPFGISVACGRGSVFTITEIAIEPPPPSSRAIRLKAAYVGQRLGVGAGQRFTPRSDLRSSGA